jgi:hypothetical protein
MDEPYKFKEKPPAKSSTSVKVYVPPSAEEKKLGRILTDSELEKRRNMVLLTHIAGEIKDNKQVCSSCGQVLYDYTNATTIGKSTFTFAKPGSVVTMTSSGPIDKVITGAVPCMKK